jgi:hypothetical protein
MPRRRRDDDFDQRLATEIIVDAILVNGHVDLPSGGREISPYAVMSFAPLAAMRFPYSRESGWL